jgi:hypothetical protein
MERDYQPILKAKLPAVRRKVDGLVRRGVKKPQGPPPATTTWDAPSRPGGGPNLSPPADQANRSASS